MTEITGYVERIVYRNEENAYCVLEVSAQGEPEVLVGTFPFVEEGNLICAKGEMIFHPSYGEQMKVSSYEVKTPEDVRAIEKYLASGAVRGIGEALARRIVSRFGEETLRIMEEEPERLAEIKGISQRMAMSISVQVEEKKDMRDALMFLSGYGIAMNTAVRIYKFYGNEIYSVIMKNPYRLADDINGIGFRQADEIAARVGICADSEYRIKSGLLYCLAQAQQQGNMFLPMEELIVQCVQLTGTQETAVREMIQELGMERRIVAKAYDTDRVVIYESRAFYIELDTARMLHDIHRAVPIEIITGGPGTGKTTSIRRLIEEYEGKGLTVALAAPTGRAAKRMEEATGHSACTIHRLLEVRAAEGLDSASAKNRNTAAFSGQERNTSGMNGITFQRNESNPLEEDVVIIDEMSMVDIFVMYALLKAVSTGTKLILVGDTNQLPSVGPGNVLADLIASEAFSVKKLDRIYRQDAQSDIILNAHRMIAGEPVDTEKKSRDFLFIKREEPDAVIAAMLTLLKEKLPKYVNASPEDIQIMTPMKKGPLGVERLNRILQSCLNPPSKEKAEKESAGTVFREGDKVMQIRNNYQIEWEVRGADGTVLGNGEGIYNGDIGRIIEINEFAELVTVEFDEGRTVEYDYSELDQMELAYAITIHKSQGSEYPAVIIPVYPGPRMLMTRNLIYTGITRAQSCVCLVGLPSEFQAMAGNTDEITRYSGLEERIREIGCC